MIRRRTLWLVAAAAPLALSAELPAQVRASEKGSVSQTVDGTTFTIAYSRPVARGRDGLFGKVVKWDRIWTPGANWATTFEVDREVRLNGEPLPAGKYSVWMIPAEQGPWTVILHRKDRLYHTQRPDTAGEQLRVSVSPDSAAHMETLAWYVPEVSPTGATLHMHWGTTVVPLRLTVTPSRTGAVPAAQRPLYVGAYALSFPDESSGGLRIEVADADGRLRGRMTPAIRGFDPEFDLIPAGEHQFNIGYYARGVLVEMNPDSRLEFTMENGRATGFVLRGRDGRVSGTGVPLR